MKNTILYIAVFLFACLNFTTPLEAKEGNLMIIIDKTEAERLVLEYPTGTTYKVLNTNDIAIEGKEQESVTIYDANDYKLIIYPTYKKSPDIFKFKNQQIKILESVSHVDPIKFHQSISTAKDNNYGQYSGDVKIEKLLVKSKQFPEEYNCVLTLSNGIVFSYIDGEAAATFYDEILDIKGKYVFESELGTTKLSYNPKNGEVWYFFESSEKNRNEN
ncbi:MAG: hypothetical protein AAF806_23800 [Bacteroidota bacterium]